ncbi:D-alanine--D-alanine ligase family protein [Tissierella creatinophila]|uniref:D-alanine--D-alanine ligase n=1 Tax=Tissierella creatinophila DSM 6911 TaxID=1123403 RepID=A0A1U7M932_TISCR|nr:D-alanine--D-alanine ligase family protein [Tissierella creatinophila]OLS03807.1 D-alanine--D-alanine ligase [Tissierella creatinophila DSM 6911]
MKTNLYVLYGGRSIEHEISIISATAVLNAVDKSKYNVYPVFITKEGQWCPFGKLNNNIEKEKELELSSDKSITQSMGDFIKSIDGNEKNIVFPVLHGNNGEDGTVQGLLELIDIPYVGNEVLSSALCMDKTMTSDILNAHNIPQARYTSIKKYQWDKDLESTLDNLLNDVNLPVFVKPANAGSSVGISKATTRDELIDSINLAFTYDVKLLIQEEVVGKEVETCIIGNNYPKASLSGELEMEDAFYDYEAKYIKKAAVPVIPAKLDIETSKRVREIALKTYEILDCRGIARVDIFVTPENKILVNEINTMPGFTSISMAPMLWQKTDESSFKDLVERLIDYALERYDEKTSISKVKVTN